MASETEMTGTTDSKTAVSPWIAVADGSGSDASESSRRRRSEASVTESLPSESSPRPEKPVRSSRDRDSTLMAFLFSTIVHTGLLIMLALLTLRVASSRSLRIHATRAPAEPMVVLQQRPAELATDVSVALSLAERPENVVIAADKPTTVRSPLEHLSEAESAPDAEGLRSIQSTANSSRSASLQLPTGGGLGGRTPEGRERLGQRYGATAESEAAVEMALAWLANHQRRDGSWSFNLELDPCGGRCRNSREVGDTPAPATGATGLALLAFLGAGYTQDEGKYDTVVRDGLYYLRSAGAQSEAGLDWQQGSMYGHGIALLAVAEALSMSCREGREQGDSDLREITTLGSLFTTRAQHPRGSWGYAPGQPGDTTITTWQVLSLVAARRNKIQLPYETLPAAHRFALSMAPPGKMEFGYRKPTPEPTTTAIGLTLMLYLGHSPYEPAMEEALNKLAKRGPTVNNLYHNYYGTLALHHARHHLWDPWQTRLRDHLVRMQAVSGHERGSWHFEDKYGDVGGRVYSTAMAAMILEVYYRYMPLYGEIEDFPLR
ncbi:prenyltransferase/squalene oxidase repeat-containing protein [Novipirellula artificiosorum]|uniref:Squalene cyclase C-terminal domain-containing protein n=1 Tax=Novipirellula artificiosorum TaxID=2528016 RepID=A0A5C6DQS0_9BACT|nr:hypothetical protein [Novipirellula artificiosorum]TWU39180.1 hypothetical protein Poly41_20020 [Novipirellula artificiosorum]